MTSLPLAVDIDAPQRSCLLASIDADALSERAEPCATTTSEPARRSGSYLRSEQSPVGRLCARAYDGMTTEIGGGVAAVGGVSAWASIVARRRAT